MPVNAAVTGTVVVTPASGAGGAYAARIGAESVAFITTGTLGRNVGSTYVPNYENFEDRFAHGRTPWIVSQKFGGFPKNLFRLHAMDDGALDQTNAFKVSIENIVQSSDPMYDYGTFDVVLREWTDNDGNTRAIPNEQFRGVNLDPMSDNYIAKRIGDLHAYYEFDRTLTSQNLVVDGNYENKSNLVRVEVSDAVDQQLLDPQALPMGFRGFYHLVTSGTMPLTSPVSTQHTVTSILKTAVEPPVPYRQNITVGTGGKKVVNSSYYWGVQFEHVTSLTTPNSSLKRNDSVWQTTKYFPEFSTANVNVVLGDNAGDPDTAQLGIVDSDRFNNNFFSLENIKVVTGSNTVADPLRWVDAVYVREGAIGTDDAAKTRAFQVTDLTVSNRQFAKFSLFVQGGFDGVNVMDREEANLSNNAIIGDFDSTARGGVSGPNVVTWRKSIEVMKSTTNVDIKLLAIPGIRHPIVTDYAILATEDRFDAMYVMDVEEYDQNNGVVVESSQKPSVFNTAQAFSDRSVDSSFAAAYYPDVVLQDPNTKTNVVVPPSVVVMGAMALNDSIGHPWFAPAGFTRGALSTTLEAKVKLSQDNLNTLADVDINPLVAFPQASGQGLNPTGGVVVWGQKTLQAAASALDRVNVRRLLIEIRRQVRDIVQTIVFEPNREVTLAKFSAAVTPRLQRIQSLSGVERFKVVIDSSTTTQADIENNTIRGKIAVVPTRTTENVSIDFVVANNGNFDNV
jgi:phage tail sheath protein FI